MLGPLSTVCCIHCLLTCLQSAALSKQRKRDTQQELEVKRQAVQGELDSAAAAHEHLAADVAVLNKYNEELQQQVGIHAKHSKHPHGCTQLTILCYHALNHQCPCGWHGLACKAQL